MKLTDEQKAAVNCPDNVLLTACPGSGKTRVIISKLVRCVDELRGTPRAAACITYTNTAVHEVEHRLRRHIQLGDDTNFDVCTIHSFCLNYIFRPFRHHIKGYGQGASVLTQDSPEFVKFVDAACADFGRLNLKFSDYEEFVHLQINATGNAIGPSITNGGIRVQEAELYWKLLQRNGFVDFCLILYFSLKLIQEHPEIGDHLASKFAWLLIDEFQDSTDLQVEILSLIAQRKRTNFFLVGDLCQSIFGFAGAKPELAGIFARRIGAQTTLTLTGNFRSSARIVRHSELLLPRQPPMHAVGPQKDAPHDPVHKVGASAFQAITEEFLPALQGLKIPVGEAAVLAPAWFVLFPLGRQLRKRGVSVVGPGARPYRRNRVFAPLAEHVCGYLVEENPEAIAGIERALFNLVLDLTCKPHFNIFSYEGRTVVFQLLGEAKRLRNLGGGGMAWLESASAAFADILVASEYLTADQALRVQNSVREMKQDMIVNRVDLANLTLDDVGVYANPKAALKLSTLHFAKGREFQAVAMIDLHEGRIPDYRAKTPEDYDAARRLFYVGMTRAERYLLYVTDTSDWRNKASRFLRAGTGVGVVA
ncbi:MAG: UvrD-helicase domain-containing protein [Hyphomicrobiaceae bacterium]